MGERMKHLLVLLLLCFSVSSAWANGSVDRLPPNQIVKLIDIQETLDVVSDAVIACMVEGRKHKECLCENKTEVRAFNQKVNTLFLEHPDLKTYDLVRFASSDGEWITQSLKGIKKQAESDPVCR